MKNVPSHHHNDHDDDDDDDVASDMVAVVTPPLDDTMDEESLAYHDTLALESSSMTSSPRMTSDGTTILSKQQLQQRRRRRRLLWTSAGLVLVGIVVLTAVLATTRNNNNTSSSGDTNGESSSSTSVGGGEDNIDRVEDGSTSTTTTTTIPMGYAFDILQPIVMDPTKFEDPTTPESQALIVVASKNLTDMNDIIHQYSLLTTFFASNGMDWTNNIGWAQTDNNNNNDETLEFCDWFGVGCNENKTVVAIQLDNNNLVGSVPPDVCLLENVETVIFSSNAGLSGRIPSCLSELTNLKELHANGCGFMGGIPPGLHKLTNLQRLTLSFNRLSGELFTDYVDGDVFFPSLRTMNLNDNVFTGTIPDEILAKASSLQVLTVHNNDVTGSLVETCPGIMLGSADCNVVVCPCCDDGPNCPSL